VPVGPIAHLRRSRCANCSDVILTLIVVFVRRILHAVLSVLGQLFQWWKLCLISVRIVLAVTTLHILIFVFVIALSSVILGAELSTCVMCRLFYYASISLSRRKQIRTQRMQGGGPKMEKYCINLTTSRTVENHTKLTRVSAESSHLRHPGTSYPQWVVASVVEQVQ